MKKLLAILLVVALVFSGFRLEKAEVAVNNIQKDGSAKVTESIKIIVEGQYEQEKYKSGINNNDLASWAELTGLTDVRMHMSNANADITGFTLRPQTLKKCDPFQTLCHGEIIMSYEVHPYYNKTTKEPIKGSGLFSVDSYKPRTTRYVLNTDTLAFSGPQPGLKTESMLTTISESVIVIDKNVYFTIMFPANTVILDLSQEPEDVSVITPTAAISQLTWTNAILGQFTVIFEVEDSLDTEVIGFFTMIPKKVQEAILGEQGIAMMAIVLILLIAYVYLKSMEKKR
jgi:hypothetical protein